MTAGDAPLKFLVCRVESANAVECGPRAAQLYVTPETCQACILPPVFAKGGILGSRGCMLPPHSSCYHSWLSVVRMQQL